MKKVYLFMTMLLSFALAAFNSVQADEPVLFTVGQSTGFWTAANPANTWASKWESTQEDPHIVIRQAKNANNMNFWDGESIKFYNSVGGSTDAEIYEITVSTGWNITGVSLDFKCDNDKGVSVALNDEEAVECWSTEDFEHVEITDLETEQVNMTVATLTPGNTTFADTKNFVITLSKKTGIEVAEAEFTEVLNQYQRYEEDDFQVGTAPGLYSEEARTAFFDAISDALDIDNLPASEITAEKYKELGDAIIAAYEALVASRNLHYDLPASTYFRVRAAMTYVNDDEECAKYMLSVKSGDKYYGYWGTPEAEDPLDQYMALWTITQYGETFDMQNVYSEARFNKVATSTNVVMSAESSNLMAFDPVYTDDEGVTYLNIRVASQEANAYLYLHQNGHKSGAGVANYVVGWSSTWSYAEGPAGTEWVLEPVSDEEAQAIIAAGKVAKARESFEDNYTELIETANLALASAQADVETTKLITDAEQLSSPWSDAEEGQDFGALIDDDPSTYWHTDWHNGNQPNHSHYLQVALAEPTHELTRLTVTRRQVANDHITRWSVYGSNDPEADDDAWQLVAKLYTPFGNNTETVSSRAFNPKDFQHLRLYIDGTTTGRGYGHAAYLMLETISPIAGSQYAAITTQANALNDVIAAQEGKAIADVTEADGQTLQAAYDAFRRVYVDPTELRDLIARAEALANGIIVGTQPGYWQNNDLGTALTSLVSQAKAYDAAAVYTAEQSNAFVDQLTAAMQPILESAIGIQEGKWYTISFGTKQTFEDNGWDLEAGNEVRAEAEEGEEGEITDEALWGKFVTVGESITENGIHYVYPMDLDDVRPGTHLFVDEEGDIEDQDMAKFRFIAVGDTAYVIQNKATGLFLHSGVTGATILDIHPSLYNVSAIGFGQNLIAARDLHGNKQNYLHIQRLLNTLVTWDATTPGSRSGLYLTATEDVSPTYDGTEFQMDVRDGQIYTFCYPVDLKLGSDNEGKMYTVNAVSGNTVTLAEIAAEGAFAGRPFIYIIGNTEDYDAENDPMPAKFAHGYSVAADPNTKHALKGTFKNIQPGAGKIIVNESRRNEFCVSHAMMSNSTVYAYEAYIDPAETLTGGTIEIIYSDQPDGIQTALANVTRRGEIYTIDGRLVARNGNLNTVTRLGRGIYIINGTKVVVK